MAADRIEATVDDLVVNDGVISVRGAPTSSPSVSFATLIGGKRFNLPITGNAKLKQPDEYRVTGTSVPRVDLPNKMTGLASFVQDLRIPGMLHGRVIRPAGVCAQLQSIDESSIRHLPGIVKVVQNGNFAGVVAEREEQAIRAARLLRVNWQVEECLPSMEELYTYLRNLPATDTVVAEQGNVDAAMPSAVQRLEATYYQPYHNHASIGPSCAVADVRDGQASVWCSTQGVYQLRGALAQLLGMEPEQIQVIHVEGAGCYGHNGFDDAAADAALLSQAVGRPVRVQWSRHDENVWEPKGPAMIMNVQGGLDAGGKIVAWDYGVWTPTHSSRPGGQAGNLLAGQQVSPPFTASRNWRGGGDRNAQHTYTFPHNRVVAHWLASSPIRQSSYRSLGGYANTFANESFMDELAAAAGVDAVEFRLRHLDDPRAIEVIRRAAEHAGWQSRPSPQASGNERIVSGRGIAYAQYEAKDAYIATIAEVDVERESGLVRVKRIVVAHDCGLVVNPDGLANQIEGNIIQAMSRALKEQVTFDRTRITSVDWLSYPILTFTETPVIEVVIFNRPDQPPLGAGESSTVTAAPAIANAIFDATGHRVRAVPFTPERLRASIESKV
jgi:CO/xanthine dehydrogenase Mo-binding subunit